MAVEKLTESERRDVERRLGRDERAKLLRDYRLASMRLMLLDYDGTLVPIARRPEEAAPDPELLDLLKKLAADPQKPCRNH